MRSRPRTTPLERAITAAIRCVGLIGEDGALDRLVARVRSRTSMRTLRRNLRRFDADLLRGLPARLRLRPGGRDLAILIEAHVEREDAESRLRRLISDLTEADDE